MTKSNLSQSETTCIDYPEHLWEFFDSRDGVATYHCTRCGAETWEDEHDYTLADPAAEKEPGEAQSATHGQREHQTQGAVLSGHSNDPMTCDWCGRDTALFGGCQNEGCVSR